MRRAVCTSVVIALCAATATSRLDAQDASSVAGDWSGPIAVPNAPIDIGLTLQRSGGTWSGLLDIPVQATKAPLVDIVVDGANVSFTYARPGNPAVRLRLSEDGTRLAGTFAQGGASFPLTLSRGAIKPLNRPQEPKRPFPYPEEAVTYRNEAAGIRLAGTLTLPPTGGPFPAVLLITGSGAQDRDSTALGHKPFLVLSDDLTRKGLAVLRVDDRGMGGSDLGPLTATTKDFAGDVRAGVAYLKSRREIDAKRIGLIGHSEGAAIAGLVAAELPEISFIVMMGGAGMSGEELLYLQSAAILRLRGIPSELIAWDRSIRRRVYELLKSERDGAPDDVRRRALLENAPPAPGGPKDSGSTLALAILQTSSIPWFRFFLAYDPAPTLSRVKCPVLALNGDNDSQVPPQENLSAIRAALQAGGNRDYTVTLLPKLNHMFQTSVTGAPDEYVSIEETLAPSALATMADWIVKHTRP
jgi:uncharacterized protein